MLFSYCECPVCEYSVVVQASVLDATHRVACPICWDDSMGNKLVAMESRPAVDSDRPEGLDARKIGEMPTFTCDKCGHECLSPVSEEAVRAEYEALHGEKPGPEAKPICHDCFKIEMARGRDPRFTLLGSKDTIMGEIDRMLADVKANRKPKPN